MILSLSLALPLLGLLLTGPAWPLVARRDLRPDEKLVAAGLLSLVVVFLVGWAAFVLRLPVAAHEIGRAHV